MNQQIGDWVCPKCGPLCNERVTFEERCDTCFSKVFWVTDDKILIDKADLAALRKLVQEVVPFLKNHPGNRHGSVIEKILARDEVKEITEAKP